MIDIVPTILEATGIQAPEMVNGIAQKPIEGVSMAYTFDKANAKAPSTRVPPSISRCSAIAASITTAGIACDDAAGAAMGAGTRQAAQAINDYKWELYNIDQGLLRRPTTSLPRCRTSSRNCRRYSVEEAKKYNVFPLANSIVRQRLIAPRPSATAGRDDVHLFGPERRASRPATLPNILNRSYTITAEVEVPADGGDGMIVTVGGRFGGYGLYLLKGKPVFNYNALMLAQFRWAGEQPLAAGKHTIVFAFTYDGPGIAKGGSGALTVDGQQVAATEDPAHHLLPAAGRRDLRRRMDTRTPVNDADYQVPFALQRHDQQADGHSRAGEADQRRTRHRAEAIRAGT